MNAKRKDQGTATIYLRVSQDKTGEGLAVERQEAECRALADRNGWAIREVFTDNDISATTGKRRPAFEALLLSSPDRVIVWHIDRLVRLSSELERVIAMRANVHAVTAGHVDLSNPAGKAVAKTIVAWAQYEGEQKSLRQKAKGKQSAAQGKSWWGKFTPFGFNADGTHHEVEAAALRKAYVDLLNGRPVSRLVDDLNAAGHRTNHGNAWTHVPLRTVLLNARNAGIRIYLGEEQSKCAWEGIVDEATYRSAVRLPVRRGRLLARAVLLRVGPIGGAHGAGAVGELEDHRNAAADGDGDQVFRGMAAGLHRDSLSAPCELAVEDAGPEVERLLDEADVFGLVDGEADAAQVQAVRIFAEPIEERLLAVTRCGVAHFAAEGVEFGEAEIGRPFAGGVGRGVPAPLRLRAQGHLGFVGLGKSL